MRNKLKVLLITGVHGNEQRSKLIVNDYLAKYNELNNPQFDLKVFHFDTGFDTRDVHFNLNRIDQVDKLINTHGKMLELKILISNVDIVLDIHNSEICSNKLLISSNGLPESLDYKVSKLGYLKHVIWRNTESESISEFARKKGKVSFTLEFGGMYANTRKTPKKDIKFLDKAIKICTEIFNYRKLKEDHLRDGIVGANDYRINLLTIYNQLVEVTLKENQYLFPKDLIAGDKVNIISAAKLFEQFPKAKNEEYTFEVVSPVANYHNKFEGCIKPFTTKEEE